MDGTTEPFIAVIGHPIAGNPSQFAVERALRMMQLEWRVLSFDVPPENLSVALDGLAVLGADGVLIDDSLVLEAARWYAEHKAGESTEAASLSSPSDGESAMKCDSARECASVPPSHGSENDSASESHPGQHRSSVTPIDCFYRDESNQLTGCFEQLAWLRKLLQSDSGADTGISPTRWVCVGESASESLLAMAAGCQPTATPPHPDEIAAAKVVLLGQDEGEAVELEAEDWPPTQSSPLVVDLTEGHPDQTRLREMGYRIITPLERRIGTLQACLMRWTGQAPAADVLSDAIEEYLAV